MEAEVVDVVVVGEVVEVVVVALDTVGGLLYHTALWPNALSP